MTQIDYIYKNYYAVQVPSDYSGGVVCNQLLIFNDARYIALPQGIEWEIVGMAKDLSEQQWDNIIPFLDMQCLTEAFGIKEETTLIIKIIKIETNGK